MSNSFLNSAFFITIGGCIVDDNLGHDFGDLIEDLARKIAVPEGHEVVSIKMMLDLKARLDSAQRKVDDNESAYRHYKQESQRLELEVKRSQKESRALQQKVNRLKGSNEEPTTTSDLVLGIGFMALLFGGGGYFLGHNVFKSTSPQQQPKTAKQEPKTTVPADFETLKSKIEELEATQKQPISEQPAAQPEKPFELWDYVFQVVDYEDKGGSGLFGGVFSEHKPSYYEIQCLVIDKADANRQYGTIKFLVSDSDLHHRKFENRGNILTKGLILQISKEKSLEKRLSYIKRGEKLYEVPEEIINTKVE